MPLFHKPKKIYEKNVDYTNCSTEEICNNLVSFVEQIKEMDFELCYTFESFRVNPAQHICSNIIENETMVGYHKHDFYEMNYVFSGELIQYIENEMFIMKKGDLIFLHPSVFHSQFPTPNSYAVNILMDVNFVNNLDHELYEISPDNFLSQTVAKKAYQIFETEKMPKIESIVRNICSYTYRTFKQKSFYELLVESEVKQLVAQLIISERDQKTPLIKYGYTNYEDKIQLILDYIKTNYANVNVDDVCKKVGYSRMQLYRIFKKYTGAGFMVYVKQQRYNHATYLLTRTNMPLDEICKTIGYDKTCFFKFIKKQTGYTPLQYRKKFSNELLSMY